jgi:hypothetical protein
MPTLNHPDVSGYLARLTSVSSLPAQLMAATGKESNA